MHLDLLTILPAADKPNWLNQPAKFMDGRNTWLDFYFLNLDFTPLLGRNEGDFIFLWILLSWYHYLASYFTHTALKYRKTR